MRVVLPSALPKYIYSILKLPLYTNNNIFHIGELFGPYNTNDTVVAVRLGSCTSTCAVSCSAKFSTAHLNLIQFFFSKVTGLFLQCRNLNSSNKLVACKHSAYLACKFRVTLIHHFYKVALESQKDFINRENVTSYPYFYFNLGSSIFVHQL